jgi:hypothetical protein
LVSVAHAGSGLDPLKDMVLVQYDERGMSRVRDVAKVFKEKVQQFSSHLTIDQNHPTYLKY